MAREFTESAVVRSRSGPGRRDAEKPEGRRVQVPEVHRDLDYNPGSPRPELRGVYRVEAQQAEPSQPHSPSMLMRRTQDPLVERVRRSH